MSKFNKESVVYTYIFGLVVCMVFAAVLSFTSQTLAPTIKLEKEIERKKFILKAALGEEIVGKIEKKDISKYYDDRVTSIVINSKGELVKDVVAETINLKREFKKENDARNLPVYLLKNEGKQEAIIFPVFGSGLWDDIWGYISLGNDMNTLKGVVFDHKGETPGLGAKITELDLQKSFIGKTIFENNDLVSVIMLKGEGNDVENESHKVDGISGATVTCNGVNDMLKNYLELYKSYINKNKSK